ncbi:MAG: signal recognition particle receptor subunit alpha, partial [Candidatus Binatia bacterium]
MEFLTSLEGQLLAAVALQVLLIVLLIERHLRDRAERRRREAAREAIPAPAREAPPPEPRRPRLLRAALAKSRDAFATRLEAVFGQPALEAMLPALEEAMVSADVGVPTSARILERLRRRFASAPKPSPEEVRGELAAAIEEVLDAAEEPPRTAKP